jgi:hypothetical protein
MSNNIDFKILDHSIAPVNEAQYKQAIARLSQKSNLTDEQKFNEYNKLDKQAKAALRLEAVDLKVRTKAIGPEFFETITLAANEAPGYEFDDPTPGIPIKVVSEYGGSAQHIVSANNNITMFELGYISSGWVKTMRWNVYQGFNNNNDKLNRNLTDSLVKQENTMAWTALEASIGSFTAYTWDLDPDIKDAPTTNYLDVSADCDGKLLLPFFQGVTSYFDRIGKTCRTIYIPSIRRGDLYLWNSDVIAPGTQEKFWNTGSFSGALIPPMTFTNVLDGTTKGSIYAYALAAEETPGYCFRKPEFDIHDTKDEGAWHMEQVTEVVSYVVPEYRRMNVLKVKFG